MSGFCTNCNSPLPDGAHFCSSCGQQLPQGAYQANQGSATSSIIHNQADVAAENMSDLLVRSRERRTKRYRLILLVAVFALALVAGSFFIISSVTDHRERKEIALMQSYSDGNLFIKMPDGFTDNGSDKFNFTSPNSEIVFMLFSSDIAAEGMTDGKYINTDTTLDYLKSRDDIICWDCSIKGSSVFGHYTYEGSDYNYYERTLQDGLGSTVIMAYPSHPQYSTTDKYEHTIEIALKTFRVDDEQGCRQGCSEKYWGPLNMSDAPSSSGAYDGGSSVTRKDDSSSYRL
ncbi:hypothetical protein PG2029B_1227 [Bifidobacterium pseudolongum subsp. globosum]|uniref:Zinc-ribbon domain-containing protein n=1 Tax=Bifidobacterium pseudolongum subsp. globosum TaxID=1690 RepID=A0A4Q5AGX8_9BIFI|nr:zinc ribbon domain-containing protein [Bifidobacterium pseudolongum]RYQ26630.1 hypothetical protein PG2032B_1226 [Bifidobacterium pseudolongum subsp. globosum]RYQ28622.1 hypothetical protein PG2029B_1227 [Bifidobacterium pseudolongum subsp. globosum]